MFTDQGTVAESVKAGADGYLSKGASREAVLQAIRDVAQGRAILDPNVTEGLFGRISGKDPRALTDRELEVLNALSEGQSTREIAERLRVSDETVKILIKQIFCKLGVRERSDWNLGFRDRIDWNFGFGDPRDTMMIMILCFALIAGVVLVWTLWRSGVFGS